MEGATTSVEGVLTDFLKPTIPKTGGESTIEGLIKLHQLVSGNAVYMLSNLRGGRHGHLALTIRSKEYDTQPGFVFVLPNNPGD